MQGCYLCDLIEKGKLDNLIMENEHAMVTFIDETREGQCLIFTKNHRKKMSEMDTDEFKSVADLIVKVSRALEKKYDCEKTYLLCISDKVEHIHFHIIPKHKDLRSMGYYTFAMLWEKEGKRETPEPELKARAGEIKAIVDNLFTS
jgi:diadenosine tetraphosphate (Ap4A) HIT family hydrolase